MDNPTTNSNTHNEESRILRESEDRFRNAFEYSAIGMALVSPEGKWLKVNSSLCKMIGYTEEELSQKTFQDITHPDDLNTDLKFVEKLLSGEIENYRMEKRYFHKQGNVIWALLAVSLVRDEAGVPLYFISQIEDITDRKQIEEDLKKYRNELQLKLAELERFNELMVDRELKMSELKDKIKDLEEKVKI